MLDIITYRNTRDQILDWLIDENREDIIEVIKHINESELLSFRLNVSGTKADLIEELRLAPKRHIWSAIEEIFPDVEDDFDDDDEEEEDNFDDEEEYQSNKKNKKSSQYNIIYPNDISLDSFNLAILNLDHSPEKLLSRIENFYNFRGTPYGIHNLTVLLSGPPGTGKTHLIKYLSKKLNRPVMLLSASTFLSKYVGETEQNTKKIFEYAQNNDLIIFIDEIEGLLQSRAGADNSWELTQVNELLVRLESFNGLCIGATNLYHSLDPAFYRRFTLKVMFSFMKEDSRWSYVFSKFFNFLNLDSDLKAAEEQLKKIQNLTPGDIEAVYKRLILDGEIHTPQFIVKQIEEEINSKKHIYQKKINLI